MPTSKCQIQMRCVGRSVPVWATFGFTGPRDQVEYQGQYSDVGRDQLITLDLNPYVGAGSLVDYGRVCYPIVVLDSGTWDPFHFHRRGVVSPVGFVFGMGRTDSQLPARFQFDDPPLPGMGTPFTCLYAAGDQIGYMWVNDGVAASVGCAALSAESGPQVFATEFHWGDSPWSMAPDVAIGSVGDVSFNGRAIKNPSFGPEGEFSLKWRKGDGNEDEAEMYFRPPGTVVSDVGPTTALTFFGKYLGSGDGGWVDFRGTLKYPGILVPLKPPAGLHIRA
jgi:hypothetical protein